MKLYEKPLIEAEEELRMWAEQLADANRDRDAAAALRLSSAILKYRCDLLESEKR